MKVVLVLISSFAAQFYFSDGISKAFIFLYKFIITGVLFILYVFSAFLAIIVVVLATIITFFPDAFGLDLKEKVDDRTARAAESIEGHKHGKQKSPKVDVQQVVYIPKAKKSSRAVVPLSKVDGLEAIEVGLVKKFHYEELKTTTLSFSDKPSSGGSGQVFKSILMDGKSVAVKRVEWEVYGEQEFLSELSATTSMQHFNLVRLHGYCSHVSETRMFYFIIYDLVKNGSLDSWIFLAMNCQNGRFLSWKRKCRVVLDVTKVWVTVRLLCNVEGKEGYKIGGIGFIVCVEDEDVKAGWASRDFAKRKGHLTICCCLTVADATLRS
ncbi:hypothetical protein GIB67_034436 [Kingdonia uniflora]|uniref:Protein kinase domain-containing protein n=1 Tax=Kingdonia uniflora TaxID=39325 RepID=A0A7J7PBR6_9MAGN|nr:hypothetical protein GIB67_034436 [Kingdonia uniflora]